VKAQSSTSAKSINEDDTCISLFATDEYVPALKADETREEVIYEPTNASNLICEQNDGDLCPGNMYKYCPHYSVS
jgi:hypothetical protein